MNDARYTAIAAALREEFPKANKGTVSMALERNGIASMQTFLESLVLAWLAQSESAAGGDDTDSAFRKNNHYLYDTTNLK